MKLLINTLTVKDFGYYTVTDPESAVASYMLQIKKLGIAIPWSATAVSFKNSVTRPGAYKSVLLSINGPAPCDQCNYNYGIEIHRKRQQPGVNNDDYYSTAQIYGGVIKAIQPTSGGQISDADKLTIEDDIITQIGLDQATNTREESIVHAKRVYLITLNAAATDTLTYTIAGVSANITLDTTGQTSSNNLNTNATFAASLVAFAKDATHIYVTSVNPELIFYLSDGGGATTLTFAKRYIWVYAKYLDIQFEVQYDRGFMSLERFNLLVLTNLSTAAGNAVLYANNTASGDIASSATSDTYADHINLSSISAYVYATATLTTGSVPIYVYSGIYELKVRSLGTAGTSIYAQYSGGGVWPSLTGKDVFNIFMAQRDLGAQSINVFLDQADPDALYNHLQFEITHSNVGAIHGASHLDNYKQRIDIYIKQGYYNGSIWDVTYPMAESIADNASFSATDDLGDLIRAWSQNVLSEGAVNDATHFAYIL